MKRNKIVAIPVMLLVTTLLAACATNGGLVGNNATPEKLKARVMERSSERWKLLNNKKYSETFVYLSESSKQDLTAREYGASLRQLNIVSGMPDASSTQCTDEKCEVTVQITTNIRVPKIGFQKLTVPSIEHWVLSGGELWLTRR